MSNEFTVKMTAIMKTAQRFKSIMNRKNLKNARTKYPYCGHGVLYGSIAGARNHFHMHCDKCDVVVME